MENVNPIASKSGAFLETSARDNHWCTQCQGDGIIQHGEQIGPARADHLDAGKIHLPQLIGRCGRMLELVGRLDATPVLFGISTRAGLVIRSRALERR